MASPVPFHKPGETVTGYAAANIVGGRFLTIAGNRAGDADGRYAVRHAAAGEPIIGVSSRDKAAGTGIMLYTFGIPGVEAGAAITAGQAVTSDATGRAVPAGTPAPGMPIALDDAAVGAILPVRLS